MKAPTKGQRFRLPEQLGGGEVEYLWASQVGYGQNWIVMVPGGGPQFDIHPNWLTEIAPPPLPAEPEPGAYLIGEVLCWRDEWHTNGLPGGPRWRTSAVGDWHDWDDLWTLLGRGRDDVSIVPLVPRAEIGHTRSKCFDDWYEGFAACAVCTPALEAWTQRREAAA